MPFLNTAGQFLSLAYTFTGKDNENFSVIPNGGVAGITLNPSALSNNDLGNFNVYEYDAINFAALDVRVDGTNCSLADVMAMASIRAWS